jgi:hypothetical protein
MTTSDKSKTSRQDRIRKVLSGAQKDFPATTTFQLAGASYTLAQIIALGQKDIAASDAATLAKATWLQAVQAQTASHAEVDPVFVAFHSYVEALYGTGQDAVAKLADFGYAPRKARSKNVAVKSAAVEKALATRQARGTTGPKAKKAITGATATATGAAPSPAPAKAAVPSATATPVESTTTK